jgi:hypothetical protein
MNPGEQAAVLVVDGDEAGRTVLRLAFGEGPIPARGASPGADRGPGGPGRYN